MVTIFKNINSINAPYHKPISVIFERIKTGTSKVLIENIRTETDKDKRNVLKKQLPSICFSGKFKTREDAGIIEHSGYICLDFDKMPNDAVVLQQKEYFKKNKYVFAVFISPSGKGLKVLIKIPKESTNHVLYFNALKDYFNSEYFDVTSKNVSRVCYESFDADIFINKDAETWTNRAEEEQKQFSSHKPILVLRSENQIIQNLTKWFQNKYSLGKGERNHNLYVLASALNEYGIHKSEAISVIKGYNCGLPEKEYEQLVSSAYSNTNAFNTKYFEDIETKKQIKTSIQSGSTIKNIYANFTKHTEQEIDNAIKDLNTTALINEFWSFDKHGKCQISHSKFKLFLEQNGFCKYYPDGSDNYIFIHISNCFIENTSPALIKDFVLKYLETQENKIPYELLAGSTKYFKDDYLSLLKAQEITMFEDCETFATLFFLNCAVKIYKDKIELIDYLELNGMVWKKHVIEREFELKQNNVGYFEKFFKLASGGTEQRINSMKSTLGYLQHSFKTLSNNRCVILNDETISENPNGGSGKGILISALSQTKRVSIIDGKQFEFSKSFAYQTVSADTQILFFDDVKKNFSFENLFSLITEGITLEKKNKDAIKIPVRKSPKIGITTNYTIGGSGGSYERRKHEVEMSSYFSSNHTPADEFGIQLFDDFDKNEWLLFDNFMLSCIQYYLNHGLIKPQSINLELRRFITSTCQEFYDFIEDGYLPLSEKFYRKAKYDEFKAAYPDYFKMSEKRFTIWIELYCKYINAEHKQGRSSSTGRWSYITKVKNEVIDLKDDDNEYYKKFNDEPF